MATNPHQFTEPPPLPPEVQEMLFEALELTKRVDQRLREKTPTDDQYTVADTPPVARTIVN